MSLSRVESQVQIIESNLVANYPLVLKQFIFTSEFAGRCSLNQV